MAPILANLNASLGLVASDGGKNNDWKNIGVFGRENQRQFV